MSNISEEMLLKTIAELNKPVTLDELYKCFEVPLDDFIKLITTLEAKHLIKKNEETLYVLSINDDELINHLMKNLKNTNLL